MKDVNYLKNNGINVEQGLEILGDMEMYNDTLNDFLTESEERLPKIKNYKEDGDMHNYSILVHAMKSDAKYLGFKQLADLSYAHEMASKESNVDYVNNNFDNLIAEAERIIRVVKEYLG